MLYASWGHVVHDNRIVDDYNFYNKEVKQRKARANMHELFVFI